VNNINVDESFKDKDLKQYRFNLNHMENK